MTTIEDISAGVTDLENALVSIDDKLTEVAVFISTLQAGAVPQEKLDALGKLIEDAKAEAAKVLADADSLDEPKV